MAANKIVTGYQIKVLYLFVLKVLNLILILIVLYHLFLCSL